VLFTFPSRYSFTIGLRGVFSLSGWCRIIQPGFPLSRPTQDTRQKTNTSGTGLSPSMVCLPRQLPSRLFSLRRSYNPAPAVTDTVWASPFSLATTRGITVVFSSSAYLDVSVRRVRLHFWISRQSRDGLPHSEICGSIRLCRSPQLIAAWHVLLRLPEPRHPPCALVYLD